MSSGHEWIRTELNVYGEAIEIRSHAQLPLIPSKTSPSGLSGSTGAIGPDESQYDLPSSWRKSFMVPRRSSIRRVGGGSASGRRTRSETNLLITKALAPPETKAPGISPLPVQPLQSYYKSQTLEFTVNRTQSTLSIYTRLGVIISFLAILMGCLDFGLRSFIFIAFVLSPLIFIYLYRLVVRESLLFIATFGVQLSQVNVLGLCTNVKFIPTANIKTVVINENIKLQRVITYIAFILHAPDATGRVVIPVFQETLPRLRTLETIYRGIFNILN